ATPGDLIAIAERYPLARTAAKSRLAAAEQLLGQQQAGQALAQLRRAYNQAVDPVDLQRVVGRIADIYEQAGQPRHARRWLRQIMRDHPQVRPMRDGRPIDAADWMAMLDRMPAETVLPNLVRPLQQPRFIEAALRLPTHQPRTSWPHDMIVTQSPTTFELRTTPGFEPRWELPADAPVDVL